MGCGFCSEIKLEDVDGKTIVLNKADRVTVVLYCTESTQEQTRRYGGALDPFKGRSDFRYVVLLDLRGSFAALAKGYVRRRIQTDLDEEAKRLRPFYRKNGNASDPRKDLSVVTDYDGSAMRLVGWKDRSKTARILVFNKAGKPWKEWEALKDDKLLSKAVQQALEISPSAEKRSSGQKETP